MKPIDPRTSAPALAGGPNSGDGAERTAAQQRHATDAARNILKSRAPAEVATDDERKVLERSQGVPR